MSLSTLPESRLHPNLDVFNSKLTRSGLSKSLPVFQRGRLCPLKIKNQKTAVQSLKLVLDAALHASLLCRHAERLQG